MPDMGDHGWRAQTGETAVLFLELKGIPQESRLRSCVQDPGMECLFHISESGWLG